MSLDYATIFDLSSLLVMPFWALMILLPGWSWTRRIIGSPWIAVPAALLYAVLVLPDATSIFTDVSNPSLEAIAPLLGSEAGATVGWVHFLAFDLLVGRWAYLDARERGIPWWLSSPILFFVLMLGPVGFLAHLLVRTILRSTTR
jgi:hypothetical protein